MVIFWSLIVIRLAREHPCGRAPPLSQRTSGVGPSRPPALSAVSPEPPAPRKVAEVIAMLSADPGPPASAVTPPSLTSLLAMTENTDGSDVEYVIGGQQLADAKRETAAQLLADDAMRIRCGKSPVLARWRAAATAGRRRLEHPRRRSVYTLGSGSGSRVHQPTMTTCRGLWPSCCGTG